jgi:hypothetical protein
MEQHGITVMTKSELLRKEDLEELEALSWDQQALVDYDVEKLVFRWVATVAFLTTLLSGGTARSCLKALASGGQMKIWIRTGALGGMRESSSSGNESSHDFEHVIRRSRSWIHVRVDYLAIRNGVTW